MEALKTVNTNTEFTINGHPIIFLPSDLDWIERFMTMIESIENRIQITDAEQKEIDSNPRAVFALAKQRDKIIREEFDSVFGPGVSDAIYAGNLTSLSDGLPIWLNFIVMLMEKVEEVMVEQKKLGNPRIDKYTAKFAKYQRK